jgi:hybrid cluster-associated redox disulfide protein
MAVARLVFFALQQTTDKWIAIALLLAPAQSSATSSPPCWSHLEQRSQVVMSAPLIHADAIVRAVMDAHPATIAVFLRRRMHCPGCAMSSLVTVAEAATSYAIETAGLLDDLRAAAAVEGRP